MFANRYFSNTYFANRYFAHGTVTVDVTGSPAQMRLWIGIGIGL